MTIGSRIKEVRKNKGLTMQDFGSSIGLSKAAISSIELNKNTPSERTVRLICSVYHVDYFWLTEGKGSMYIDNTEALIDELVAEQNLDAETSRILKQFLSLSSDSQTIVLKAIDSLLNENKKSE